MKWFLYIIKLVLKVIVPLGFIFIALTLEFLPVTGEIYENILLGIVILIPSLFVQRWLYDLLYDKKERE